MNDESRNVQRQKREQNKRLLLHDNGRMRLNGELRKSHKNWQEPNITVRQTGRRYSRDFYSSIIQTSIKGQSL